MLKVIEREQDERNAAVSSARDEDARELTAAPLVAVSQGGREFVGNSGHSFPRRDLAAETETFWQRIGNARAGLGMTETRRYQRQPPVQSEPRLNREAAAGHEVKSAKAASYSGGENVWPILGRATQGQRRDDDWLRKGDSADDAAGNLSSAAARRT